MKKKIEIGGLKVKISWKNSRLWKSIVNTYELWTGKKGGYTLRPQSPPNPERLRRQKIYRLFNKQYCEWHHANHYGINGTLPSSYVYYKGCEDLKCERCLIGEFMFGEDKIDFFLRKGIFIEETIHEYRITQGEYLLATFNKDWVEAQGQYQ